MVVPDEFSKDGDQEADYVRIREGLRKLVAKANAAGITVTVEDYGGTGNPCSYTLENLVGDDILADVRRQVGVVRSWCK